MSLSLRLEPEGEGTMQKMSQKEELAKMLSARARKHTLTPEQISRAMEEKDYDASITTASLSRICCSTARISSEATRRSCWRIFPLIPSSR